MWSVSESTKWVEVGLLVLAVATTCCVAGWYSPTEKIPLWSTVDKTCSKCGKMRLDTTKEQLAAQNAKKRLELYTKTLKEEVDQDYFC